MPRARIGDGGVSNKALGRTRSRSRKRTFSRSFEPGPRALRPCCSIKAFLRGMGNIYADESLWRAAPPSRPNCSKSEIRATGGASIVLFARCWRMQSAARIIHFRFSRCGRPARRISAAPSRLRPCWQGPVTLQDHDRRIVVAGRGSYFCPRCQAPPRKTSRHRINAEAPLSRQS